MNVRAHGMDKQNWGYPYNGVLCRHKRMKYQYDYNIDELQVIVSAISQAQKTTECMIPSI